MKNQINCCPLCGAIKHSSIINLACGNPDHSTLYQVAKVVSCEDCGHIYNLLTPLEVTGLNEYYESESSLVNTNTGDGVSDRPGSNSILARQRYFRLYSFLSSYIKQTDKILDSGCATGGFLDYLFEHGFKDLHGLDMSKRYVNYARKKNLYDVQLGNVESIPFDDNSMNFIIMDQVFEHLIDPSQSFKEVKRVLKKDGLVCISVPNAAKYGDNYFFDFFWFLIREHVQHFDLNHLNFLANLEGFELVDSSEYETSMMSKEMILPVLTVIFRFTGKKQSIQFNRSQLDCSIRQYVQANQIKTDQKKGIIKNLVETQQYLYVWGIGREFMYLYESVGLKKCNIIDLIDISSHKQYHLSVDGKRIIDPSVLSEGSNISSPIL